MRVHVLLQLLDIRTYTSIRGFQHQSYKNGVNWNRATVSPDAQYVVAGGHDGSVVLWRKSTGIFACMYVCMYVCMYTYVCVCVCVCV